MTAWPHQHLSMFPKVLLPQPGLSTHNGQWRKKQLSLEGNKNVFFLAKQISLHLVMYK